MCTSPVRIYNRRRSQFEFLVNSEPFVKEAPYRRFHDVPCGSCPECLRQRHHDFFFRSYSEYLSSSRYSAFCTFTYAPKHLPSVEVNSEPLYDDKGNIVLDGVSYSLSTWYKPHIQKYFKSLNERLIYIAAVSQGITRYSKGSLNPAYKEFIHKHGRPLHYICVCERGKSDSYLDDNGRLRFGTSRPHYHALVFLQPSYQQYFSPESFVELCYKLWPYGNSYNVIVHDEHSKRSEYQDAVSALFYVCKYVNKQSIKIPQNVPDYELRRPFVLQSKFFGANWLSEFANAHPNDFLPAFLERLRNAIPFKIGPVTVNVNLPAYYLNRVRFNTVRRDPFDDEHKRYREVVSILDNPFGVPSLLVEKVYLPDSQYVSLPSSLYSDIERSLLHDRATEMVRIREFCFLNVDFVKRAWNDSYMLNHRLFRSLTEIYSVSSFLSDLQEFSSDDLYIYVVESSGFLPDSKEENLLFLLSMISRYRSHLMTVENQRKYSEYLSTRSVLFNKEPVHVPEDSVTLSNSVEDRNVEV